MLGVGLALVVVQFLPYDFEEPIAYGLMFLFAGTGLLIYYTITRRQEHHHDESSASRPHAPLSEREPIA